MLDCFYGQENRGHTSVFCLNTFILLENVKIRIGNGSPHPEISKTKMKTVRGVTIIYFVSFYFINIKERKKEKTNITKIQINKNCFHFFFLEKFRLTQSFYSFFFPLIEFYSTLILNKRKMNRKLI
jgi:hypothetical protein